jgi:hypothetical protein
VSGAAHRAAAAQAVGAARAAPFVIVCSLRFASSRGAAASLRAAGAVPGDRVRTKCRAGDGWGPACRGPDAWSSA